MTKITFPTIEGRHDFTLFIDASANKKLLLVRFLGVDGQSSFITIDFLAQAPIDDESFTEVKTNHKPHMLQYTSQFSTIDGQLWAFSVVYWHGSGVVQVEVSKFVDNTYHPANDQWQFVAKMGIPVSHQSHVSEIVEKMFNALRPYNMDRFTLEHLFCMIQVETGCERFEPHMLRDGIPAWLYLEVWSNKAGKLRGVPQYFFNLVPATPEQKEALEVYNKVRAERDNISLAYKLIDGEMFFDDLVKLVKEIQAEVRGVVA